MRTIVLVLVVLLGVNGTPVMAQESSQIGTSMANFLKIGVGPRATAMGDALVALNDDASALYWNPAGLGFMTRNEVLMQSNAWIGDTKLYFFGIVLPFGDLGSAGASVTYFDAGNMEETTLQQPDGTGRSFSVSDLALGISYAKRLTDRFSVGGTIKYVRESLFRETGDAITFDIGSIYTTSVLNDLRIGISLSNLGGAMKLDGPDLLVSHDVAPDVPTNKSVDASLATQSWDLPLTFRIGVGTYVLSGPTTSLAIEAAVNDTRDFAPRFNAGAELAFRVIEDQCLFLRGGYKGNYDDEGVTAGVGLHVSIGGVACKVDYGYAAFSLLGGTHRYAMSILF